jgi:ribosome-associated heat shock protein Hsp15
MRLDKWLWAARFYKTRQIAIGEINKGRILVNEDKPKPARMLKIGDNLTIKRGFDVYNVTVLLLLPMRGSATIAQTMYDESIENQNIRIEAACQRSLNIAPKPESKPNKHDRQMLRDIRQSF